MADKLLVAPETFDEMRLTFSRLKSELEYLFAFLRHEVFELDRWDNFQNTFFYFVRNERLRFLEEYTTIFTSLRTGLNNMEHYVQDVQVPYDLNQIFF